MTDDSHPPTRTAGSIETSTGLVVRPIRFTSDVAAMQAFLETVGLARRIESERGGWVVMVAGSGMVALHDAATSGTGGLPGQTGHVQVHSSPKG